MHGKKREPSEWSLRSPGGLSVLASVVGGLLTRTLVSSQVECVTENACVYSFYMLMWLLCDFNAAKLFLGVNILLLQYVLLYHSRGPIPRLNTLSYSFGSVPVEDIYKLYCT